MKRIASIILLALILPTLTGCAIFDKKDKTEVTGDFTGEMWHASHMVRDVFGLEVTGKVKGVTHETVAGVRAKRAEFGATNNSRVVGFAATYHRAYSEIHLTRQYITASYVAEEWLHIAMEQAGIKDPNTDHPPIVNGVRVADHIPTWAHGR